MPSNTNQTPAEAGAKFQIKRRYTGAVLFECDLPADVATQSRDKQLGYAVKGAIKARADLTGADLTGANLTGADLAGADLTGADLTGADLARADLTGADLTGADLARADLTGADLTGADLARADLAGADLTGADLTGADLTGADLAGANLTDADLTDANLTDADLTDANLAGADLTGAKNVPETNGSEAIQSGTSRPDRPARKTDAERAAAFRARNPDVPVVENLDAKILAAVTIGGGTLNMSSWHTCQTTHCRAGWAITLAGPEGAALEAKYGPFRAGSMLYRASTGRVPHFFATTERAMEDIKRCAGEQA